MGIFGTIGEDPKFDEDFASPADYDDGFVESDAVRLRREAEEARRAAEDARRREAAMGPGRAVFDFSRVAEGLPTPEQWEREAAAFTKQYYGLDQEQTAAMGLFADASPAKREEDGPVSARSGPGARGGAERVLEEAERIAGKYGGGPDGDCKEL